MNKFFGQTGYSFFEYWTLGHFAFWFWAGTVTAGLNFNRLYTLIWGMVAALAWEILEVYLEKAFPLLATHPESWWNRWISDPMMCIYGLLLAWYGFDHWRSS